MDFHETLLYGGLCLFAAFLWIIKSVIISYYHVQGGYVFTHVRLLDALSAGLHNNCWADFHKTWMET